MKADPELDRRIRRLRQARYRMKWLHHLREGMEGRDGGIIDLLLPGVELQVAVLEGLLQRTAEWPDVVAYLEREEKIDFRLLVKEVS